MKMQMVNNALADHTRKYKGTKYKGTKEAAPQFDPATVDTSCVDEAVAHAKLYGGSDDGDEPIKFYAGFVFGLKQMGQLQHIECVGTADGAHCVGPAKGTFYSATKSDANHKTHMLLGMHNIRGESNETLGRFAATLAELDEDFLKSVWIVDEHAALLHTFSGHLFRCARHRSEHVGEHGRKGDQGLYSEMTTCTEDKLEGLRAKLSGTGLLHVNKVPDKEQFACCNEQINGRTTNSVNESLQYALKAADVRNSGPFKAAINLARMAARHFVERQQAARRASGKAGGS
jgi:hypothetical protein